VGPPSRSSHIDLYFTRYLQIVYMGARSDPQTWVGWAGHAP
jgi:hypothetical protein